MKLDDFDAKLLNLLQANNRLTSHELAKEVNLSPAACARRVAKLRQEGVIEADVAIVSPEKLGKRLTMVVMVTVEREQPQLLDEFKRSMLSTQEVSQCYYVTGDADFILIVNVEGMAEYEAFTNRFLFENRNVRRFQTMVVMNRVKFETAVQAFADS